MRCLQIATTACTLMCRQIKIFLIFSIASSFQREIVPMEDDEDLEFLRLAALKSLNNKKDADLPHISPPSSTHLINGNISHIQPIGESARQLVNDYYNSAKIPSTHPYEPPTLNEFVHTGGAYLHSNFDKIDLSDPYAAPILHPIGGTVLNDYQPPYVTKPSPNVQLSPRSAAFVLQNNDILMRRKTGRSPDSPPRSHSPLPYRKSPGRWSPTPPPMAKSRSPKRSPSYGYRRSISPPPIIRRTPPYIRNRSISRSPQRRRHSPFPIHARRSKSRSPLSRSAHTTYRTQPRPRSPIPHSSSGSSNRRTNSPPNRNAPRGWRGNSPPPASGNRTNGNRRSVSPRGNDESGNYRGPVRRRSRSPLNNKVDGRRRSTSRSPGRKYQRNATVRRRRSPPPPPPAQKFNPRNTNNSSRNNAPTSRNRPNNPRRSASPSNNSHRRSKSRSPLSTQQNPKSENNTESKDAAKQEQTKVAKKVENPANDRKPVAPEPSKTEGKTEQEIEDELLASTNDEASDSGSDNDDDGIDLFASEESESENEGRFKLSSRQTEKPSAAVSFSKLGTNATTELRELEEPRGDKATSAMRKNGRDERERDRERGGSRNAYRRDPNGRYGGRKQELEPKTRDSNRPWKGSKTESRRKDLDAGVASEKERNPIMFKSTFHAVDPETRTKTPDAGTFSAFHFTISSSFQSYKFHFFFLQINQTIPRVNRAARNVY